MYSVQSSRVEHRVKQGKDIVVVLTDPDSCSCSGRTLYRSVGESGSFYYSIQYLILVPDPVAWILWYKHLTRYNNTLLRRLFMHTYTHIYTHIYTTTYTPTVSILRSPFSSFGYRPPPRFFVFFLLFSTSSSSLLFFFLFFFFFFFFFSSLQPTFHVLSLFLSFFLFFSLFLLPSSFPLHIRPHSNFDPILPPYLPLPRWILAACDSFLCRS